MSRVAYVVNDVLGEICKTLGISGWELLDGHYAFTDLDAYYSAKDEVEAAIWRLLDDEDPDNDDTAYGYLETLDTTNYVMMFWSTEAAQWV